MLVRQPGPPSRQGSSIRKCAQNASDEGSLGVGVGLSVQAVDRGELVLQGGILVGNGRSRPKAISKPQPLVPERAAERYQVQMVRSHRKAGLAEPVHHIDPVRGELVA